jgi:glycosyltransferase involved in cell wall biosynthesis
MSKKLHYLPLENIEQRYTKLMNEIVSQKSDYVYYPQDFEEKKISKGEFLDIERTVEFKAKQLAMVSHAFQKGLVSNGDCFFVADIFFFGIENIKYMAELQNIKISIVGFNHAGRADSTDFVQKLGNWSDYAELSCHQTADKIFAGSNYHRGNILKYFDLPESKVITTGCVWDSQLAFEVYPILHEKENFVIYPHRLCKEKGFDDFINICNYYPEYKFVVTSSGNKIDNISFPKNVEYVYGLTKKEYYAYMSKAKYYLSTAYQETFGYTIQEALLYNCVIAAPSRVCYPEVVEAFALYNSIEDVGRIFSENKTHENSFYKNKFTNNFNYLLELLLCKDKKIG